MNLIACGENCRHQKDGYCILDDLTCARNTLEGSKCAYFEVRN